jgi:16S rRNA G966 N2-methylase RsmD
MFPAGIAQRHKLASRVKTFILAAWQRKLLRNQTVAAARLKSSALLDARVIYCGDIPEQPAKLPDACVNLIYIDPPFNSNRNYEVFCGETREKRAFEEQGVKYRR